MLGDNPEDYWQWFRRDGTIMRSGYFKNGRQTGEWTTYNKKGRVYKVNEMKAWVYCRGYQTNAGRIFVNGNLYSCISFKKKKK